MEEKNWSGYFVLDIIRCQGLASADTFSKSDPYCCVIIEKNGKVLKRFKTKMKMDNNNPHWNQKYVYEIYEDPGEVTFRLEVYDYDDVGDDDFLGLYEFKVLPDSDLLKGGQPPATLQKRAKGSNKFVKGEIFYELNYYDGREVDTEIFEHGDAYEFPSAEKTKLILGPVLIFRGIKNGIYGIGAVVIVEGGGDKPHLTVTPKPVSGIEVKHLLSQGNRHTYVYDWSIKQSLRPIHCKYKLNDNHHSFWIPGTHEKPRMLSCSCNGFHNDDLKKELKEEEFYLWKKLVEGHKKERYHLILQGGDQIYADPIFEMVEELHAYPCGDMKGKKATEEEVQGFIHKVEKAYMDLYIKCWVGDHITEGLASVPSVMMWDDHDIFDGWGSYDDELIKSPLYQNLFKVAEKYFCALQLGCTPDSLPPATLHGKHAGKSQMHIINGIGIAALDLRTERSKAMVMRNDTYDCFEAWLASNGKGMDHLFVISSIPVIYNDFEFIESKIAGLGLEIEDDLLDHWRAENHKHEREKLIKQLFDFSDAAECRVTLLSGDVHIGALGCMVHKELIKKSNAGAINSLISSAIVNVPPPEGVVSCLELNASDIEKVNKDIISGLVRFPPYKLEMYIRQRNFLKLSVRHNNVVIASWVVENPRLLQQGQFQVYIAPYKKGALPDVRLKQESGATSAWRALMRSNEDVHGWFH